MSTVTLDTTGLKCPQPILKIAVKALEIAPEDILEVTGDCPTFEADTRTWAERMQKIVIAVKDEGGGRKRIQIQF